MPTRLPPGFLARPFAHRGLHDSAEGRVENSPSAFAAAIAAGYAIELDVQLSADGVAVVFHDPTLDRLTGEVGRVAGRSSGDLARIPLGATSDAIPTLADTLTQIGGRVPLLIELKDQTGDLGPSDGRLEAAVADGLRSYEGPVAVMSFNPSMVERLTDLAPKVPRGLTTDTFSPEAWRAVPPPRLERLRQIDTEGVGAAFVSHDHRDLSAPRIAALRAAGVPILTWTVRSPEAAAAALRVAHAITFEGYRPEQPSRPG